MRQFYAALLLLFAGTLANSYLTHGETHPLRTDLSKFPTALSQWNGTEVGLDPEVLTQLGATEVLMRRYISNSLSGRSLQSLPVWLYIGYYQSQRQGQTYHSPKNCLPGSGWQIVKSEQVSVRIGPEKSVLINKVIIHKGLAKEVVLYWYQDRGRVIASEYWAKIYMVYDAITRNRTDGAMVRISAPIVESEEKTLQEMLHFTQEVFPHLGEYLPV